MAFTIMKHLTMLCTFLPLKPASCNDKQFTSSSGAVSSPVHFTGRSSTKSPTYASDLNCEYDITVAVGSAIRLRWTTFDVKGSMPSCENDYVEIFVGCGRHSIGKYCSDNSFKPFDVYSPNNCLRLKFHSDRTTPNGKGFLATYSTISLSTGKSVNTICL